MNIYFVNKQSRIKGPFDVKSAFQSQLLRIGDVCIRDTEEGLLFLLIVNNSNRWNACKCIDKARYTETQLNGNSLLFSFNGIEKRVGNIECLEWLSKIYTSEIIHKFFMNAIDILTYKCDFWDINLFIGIHSMNPTTNIGGKNDCINDTPKKIIKQSYPLFYSYLKEELRNIFVSMYEKDVSLKDIYVQLRSQYSADFRKAIKDFLKDNSQATIYDKI